MRHSAFVFTHPNSENLIILTSNQDEAVESFSAHVGKPKAWIQQWVGKVTVKDNKVFEFLADEHTPLSNYVEVGPKVCPACGSTQKAA